MNDINYRTGDHTRAVLTPIDIQIGVRTHTFEVACTRAVADVLRPEDWKLAKQQVQFTMDGAVRHLLLNGVLPSQCAAELNMRAEQAMRSTIYAAFRTRNVAAGNLTFQVDPILKGKRFRT